MATTIPISSQTNLSTGMESSKGVEVTQVIISDHERVKTLYNNYKSERRVNEKQNLARNIIREIKVHSALEETILYPTFRERLPNGNVLADQNLQEHASIEKKLDNLNNMSVADDEVSFDREMALMMQELQNHITDEETQLIPLIRNHYDATLLNQLGEQFESNRNKVPTRPHPLLPHEGLPGKVAGMMAAPLDKAADKLSSH